MEAYCVKCKAKREMKDPTAVTMKNGKPATSGTCADLRHEDVPDRQRQEVAIIGNRAVRFKRTALFMSADVHFGVNDVPQPQLLAALGLMYFQPPSSRLAVL